uniref:Uncharacterized protein n=1 Tax=Anguilla anguilla TaxID=7936 RepID=A0A0E9W247_ANGAN
MLSWLELPVESSVTSFPATFKTSFSGFSTYSGVGRTWC